MRICNGKHEKKYLDKNVKTQYDIMGKFDFTRVNRPGQLFLEKKKKRLDKKENFCYNLIRKKKGEKKMHIQLTDDPMYPISISDSWGKPTYVHLWTVQNDDDWNNFLNELNMARKKFLEGEK